MPRLLLSRLWIAALLLGGAGRAGAEEAKHFDIPEGRAPATLTEFARQAGVELLYASNVVDGLPTLPVAGDFAPIDALRRMLAGTDLIVTQGKQKGALAITRPPPQAAAQSTSIEKKNQT